MARRIGLTGGIASGKSTVAKLFIDKGIDVIDADQLARELVVPGQAAWREILETFGPEMINTDGTLNRKALRGRIFSDKAARQRLESILHPRIRKLLLERAALSKSPYALLVIPLLVEKGWQKWLDNVIVVDCSPETQIRRLIARDHIDEGEAQAILNTQATRAQRLAVADAIIHNEDGDAPMTEVTLLDKKLRAGAPLSG